MPDTFNTEPDVVLIGAGIMSSTLGVLLKEFEPSLSIQMFETLEAPALESSEAWNNAGTGHAANCEMNYTPQRADGSIDISKALEVNVEFDLSRQLWSFLVTKGSIKDPRSFIHPIPHMCFVRGIENVSFLRKRFEAMTSHHCYYGMEYTEDKKRIADWVPLVMEGRADDEPVSATRIVTGTDVDYGSLTNHLVDHLSSFPGFGVHYLSHVTNISREADGRWRVETENTKTGICDQSRPSSSSLERAAAPCRCFRNPASPRARGMVAFRSAASGCAATTPTSTSVITPRSMEKPLSDRHPCRCRTSTLG